MHHLHKLGVPMQNDVFYEHLMDFSINYVLRELKHHARIPVPGYTFVGVADVHGWLEPNDIFVCITNEETGELEYLEGEMMVTRYVIGSSCLGFQRNRKRPPTDLP